MLLGFGGGAELAARSVSSHSGRASFGEIRSVSHRIKDVFRLPPYVSGRFALSFSKSCHERSIVFGVLPILKLLCAQPLPSAWWGEGRMKCLRVAVKSSRNGCGHGQFHGCACDFVSKVNAPIIVRLIMLRLSPFRQCGRVSVSLVRSGNVVRCHLLGS